MALLQFQNVNYWYTENQQKKHILKNMNVSFERGRFYTVIGPSGSGKTTFLSLAGGLDKTKEGSILYEGTDIKKIGLTAYRNQYVSIVFQAYNLLPYMTALQNVITAMEITKTTVKDKKVHALNLLAKVGITEEQAKQKVLTLSGGQQQRVSIARALSCQSDLIVADEPTGNLDEDTAREIVKLFQRLAHEEQKCIIMVTHDQSIAAISDTVLKLSKGTFTVQESKIPSTAF
ncbi:ABC transporter ATP-binding protein [Bacillus kexueae]|uniref:ABC transporter ATP-binding protein n=1 Tax=Aeribacillus kexueae TaxID=2078952 RepID=UPI001FAFC9A0|nr:ABC transporter ATP-binding protein [Bacillus kexueae]